MKKLLITVIVSGFVTVSTFSMAATNQSHSPSIEDAKQPAVQMVQELIYKGIVEKHDEGTALITSEKTYLLAGGDFTPIIGKEVRILGSVVQDGEAEKLIVSKFEIAHD